MARGDNCSALQNVRAQEDTGMGLPKHVVSAVFRNASLERCSKRWSISERSAILNCCISARSAWVRLHYVAQSVLWELAYLTATTHSVKALID